MLGLRNTVVPVEITTEPLAKVTPVNEVDVIPVYEAKYVVPETVT